jgi:hypothetical protein
MFGHITESHCERGSIFLPPHCREQSRAEPEWALGEDVKVDDGNDDGIQDGRQLLFYFISVYIVLWVLNLYKSIEKNNKKSMTVHVLCDTNA